MKHIKIKLNKNGSINYTKENLMLDNENNSVRVVIEYPNNYEEYEKRCDIIGGSGLKTIKLSSDFDLTKNELQNGYMKLQPIATLDDTIVKWEIARLYVSDSLNVLENDDNIDDSVGEVLLQLIETKQNKINIEPTWSNLDKLLKGEVE